MEFTYVRKDPPKSRPAETPGTAPEPPAVAVEPEPLSAEELAQNTKDLYQTMGWGDAPPEALVPETTRTSPEPPAPAAGASPAPTPPPPAAPPAAPPEPPPAEPTAAQLISQAARETAREVATALRQTEPAEPAPEPEFELSEEDRKDLPVLEYLERTNPQKYGGIVKATLDYFKAHYDYAQAWMEANPDKEYDPDEQEHAAWIAEHQPPNISREDLDEARIDMRVEQKFEREIKPRFDQQEAERAFNRQLPAIGGRIDTAVKQIVRAVDPALADLLKDANGAETLSNETIAKIEEKDPIARDEIDKVVREELEPMILELEKTVIPELHFKLDMRNPVHKQIRDFVSQKEAELARAPMHEQMLDGKRWVSLDEYARLINQIQKGRGDKDFKTQAIADLDRTVWCLDVPQIEELMVDYCANKAKARIAKQDALAAKKYGKANGNGSGQPARASTPPAGQPVNTGTKPKPPSLAGQAVSVSTPVSAVPPSKSYGEAAADVMFSR